MFLTLAFLILSVHGYLVRLALNFQRTLNVVQLILGVGFRKWAQIIVGAVLATRRVGIDDWDYSAPDMVVGVIIRIVFVGGRRCIKMGVNRGFQIYYIFGSRILYSFWTVRTFLFCYRSNSCL